MRSVLRRLGFVRRDDLVMCARPCASTRPRARSIARNASSVLPWSLKRSEVSCIDGAQIIQQLALDGRRGNLAEKRIQEVRALLIEIVRCLGMFPRRARISALIPRFLGTKYSSSGMFLLASIASLMASNAGCNAPSMEISLREQAVHLGQPAPVRKLLRVLGRCVRSRYAWSHCPFARTRPLSFGRAHRDVQQDGKRRPAATLPRQEPSASSFRPRPLSASIFAVMAIVGYAAPRVLPATLIASSSGPRASWYL